MIRPIRILQTGMTSNLGGVESVIMNIYRNLDRTKVQFDFLVQNGTTIAYENEILDLGGRIHRVFYGRRENLFRHFYEIIKIFKKYKDIQGIHLNTCCLEDIDVIILAKVFKIPLRIIHSHSSNYISRPSKMTLNIEKLNKRLLAKYSTELYACSKEAGQWMFDDNIFKVINNGIDIEKFTFNRKVRVDVREELGIQNKFVVGHVGRFTGQKNHEFLIEIFEEIYSHNKDAVLLLVGEGSLEDSIRNMLKEKDFEQNVIFTGLRDDVNRLYQGMDVFVMPSKFEGLGVALIEAQASGLKAFTSKDVVPKESKVTELLEFISLEETPGYWANRIINQQYERIDTYIDLVQSGYDIKKIVIELEERYIS